MGWMMTWQLSWLTAVLAVPILVGALTIVMNVLPPLETKGLSKSDTENAYCLLYACFLGCLTAVHMAWCNTRHPMYVHVLHECVVKSPTDVPSQSL